MNVKNEDYLLRIVHTAISNWTKRGLDLFCFRSLWNKEHCLSCLSAYMSVSKTIEHKYYSFKYTLNYTSNYTSILACLIY